MSTVTLVREAENSTEGKAYGVLVDGVRVGNVHQGMVTHDRKPRGARIVTRRTQSLRWFSIPSGGWSWHDARWEAVAVVLAGHLGGHLDDHEQAARAATVTRSEGTR